MATNNKVLEQPSDTVRLPDDSLTAKVYRELALLGSLKTTFGEGVSQSAFDALNNGQAAALLGSSALVGTAIAMATRNPRLFGSVLQPVVEFGLANCGKIGALALVTDLVRRVGDPIADTWASPEYLAANQKQLGDNLGSAAVDYALLSAGGALGAIYGRPLVESAARFINPLAAGSGPLSFAFAGSARLNTFLKPGLSPEAEKSAQRLAALMKATGKAGRLVKDPPLELSGKVTFGEKPKPKSPVGDRGDMLVFPTQSTNGNTYLAGRVSNGTKWCTVDMKDTFGPDIMFYQGAAELAANTKAITQLVEGLHGEPVFWSSAGDWPQYRLKTRPASLQQSLNEIADRRAMTQSTDALPEIQLTGNVYSNENESPRAGDIRLFHRLDGNGRYNVANRHTNYGYSGYFGGSVYDGQHWTNLDLWSIVGESNARYDFSYEIPERQQAIAAMLSRSKGTSVEWASSSVDTVPSRYQLRQ